MDKSVKKVIGTIIFWVAVVCLVMISAHNICTDVNAFFSTNITSVLSIGAVLFISYYLTQMRNDERKMKDNIERLLLKIQQELSRSELINGNSNMCLLYQKSIANKIEYLKTLGIDSINNDLNYISEQFQTFRDVYGAHMNDDNFPEIMEQDFQRIIVNINDKCDMMLIQLRL